MQQLTSFADFMNNSRQHPWLDTGSSFEGTLRSRGPIELEGAVSGKIIVDDVLIIAETATIHADIIASEVIIYGVVRGNISASKGIYIQSTAKIFGEVSSPALMIEEGALFEGSSIMKEALRVADPDYDDEVSSPAQDLQQKLRVALG